MPATRGNTGTGAPLAGKADHRTVVARRRLAVPSNHRRKRPAPQPSATMETGTPDIKIQPLRRSVGPRGLILLLAVGILWCGCWHAVPDYMQISQPFPIPPHDPQRPDEMGWRYMIRQGPRLIPFTGSDPFLAADPALVVKVTEYRFDTDGDGRHDLIRQELDFPEAAQPLPDGRQLMNPAYRAILLFIGVQHEPQRGRWRWQRVLIDKYDAQQKLGADGIFERQIVAPPLDRAQDTYEQVL
jgi:hypothetical protein